MRARPRNLLRLLTVSAVAAASLTVAGPAGAAAPSVQISPVNPGDTAVHDGLQISVRGTADQGPVQSARFVGIEADGDVIHQDVAAGALNRVALPPNDTLRNDPAVGLNGRLTLPCIFSPPDGEGPFDPNQPCQTHDAVVEMFLEVTVDGQTGTSNRLPVDFDRPVVLGYELVDVDRVRVLFNEPVRHRQCDAPSDWQVTSPDRQVTAVLMPDGNPDRCTPGTGGQAADSRLLVLDLPVDEDAEPVVTYTAGDGRVPGREKYVDAASNQVLGFLRAPSVDLVRPPLPRITKVDDREGAPPASLTGTSPQPVLGVEGLRDGHVAYVERVTAGAPPVKGPETTATGPAASVTAPPLPADGPHELRVVVRDPHGNLSTDSGKTAARADQSPSAFTYVLDTLPPRVVGALAEDGDVRVFFSEDVVLSDGSEQDDAPSLFAVRAPDGPRDVQSVAGTGRERLLTVEGDVPAGSLLDYSPVDARPRYADVAGNPVPERLDVPVAGLAPPVVEVPATQLFTRTTTTRVAGTLPGPYAEGTVVDVLRDTDGDGEPDGDPVVSLPVGADRSWGGDVGLLADRRNDLLVRARSTDPALVGPAAAVPAVVQDGVLPAIELLAPAGGEVLPGGRPATVRWSSGDANPGTVLVEVSTDGTRYARAVEVPAAASGEQQVDVVLPDVDTTAARVRVTSTDRAGNARRDTSAPFTIDALRPVFTAVTTTGLDGRPTDVRLSFSEPVTGLLPPGAFTVDGRPATAVQDDGSPRTRAEGARSLLLRTTPFDADAQPTVTYTPPPVEPLQDRAGQGVEPGARSVPALDRIRPPTPRVESVDGDPVASGRTTGNAVAPSVAVSGVRAGHAVHVQRLVAGAVVQRGEEVIAGAGTTTAPARSLPVDGDHALRAVVRDVNGNLSTQALPGSPADGTPSTVTYRLDTRAPTLVAAVSAGEQVTVLLSERVSGSDDPAHWRVPGRTVTEVEGTDGERTRVLTVTGGSLSGLRLSYAPSAGRYVDAAGNGLRDGSVDIDGVSAPVVLRPAAPVFTPERAVAVSGSVRTALDGAPRPGTVVDVLRDTDGDGDGDTPLVRGVPVDGAGAWSTSVPLDRNAQHAFVVRSRASDGAVPDSADVPVPLVTQDDLAPALAVTSPQGGEVLAGGQRTTARWTTSDANRRTLRVDLTTDGTTFAPVGTVTPPADGAGELAVVLPDVDTDRAQVRVTAVDRAGNRTARLSPVFTIDALAPTFVAVTTDPRTVRLTFSEPVSGTVAPFTDFTVDGRPAAVTSVDGRPTASAEDARTVVLTVPSGIGEDARPTVTYAPSPLGQLVDRAGQPVAQRVVTAVDGIRPAVPTVTAVDGRQPEDGRVLGGSVVPQVAVGDLVAGQFVRVERVPAAGRPVAGPEVETQGSSALVPAPRLPDDGEHLLRVVVRDAAGNTSTDTAKSPGRDDQGPSDVTYVLDTDLPAVLFAVADEDEIVVRFTEALFPEGGDPADWRVTRPDGSPVPLGDRSVTVVAVRGSGDTRVLQATGVRPGSLLVYAPRDDRYADANGNPLPDTTTPLLAVEPPVVTTPARALFVTTGSTTVAGTSQPGSTVSLLRRGRDGGPSGTAVASARTGEDGRWSLTAPLEADQANDFLVQAQRTDGRTTIAVPVPTITQDGAAPVLSVDGFPGDQQRLAPGSARTLSWAVCDANLGVTPMVVEFSADDGASWSRLGPERLASPNDCEASTSRRLTLPGTSETSAARLRVSAVDLAGRTTSALSPRFVLAGDTVVRDVTGFACPPDRVRPAGFTDTSTSTFRFEIDCLAAYQFTKGVTADRYEPLGTVTRAQMALFVARVAAYAGVPLDTADAGFTDIADRSQETRDAINALANLDVVEGVGGGRYAPADPVSRGQMASFLARVQQRVGTPFPASRDAFRDDDGTTHEANIDLIAGAGVVQGTAPGTYQPLAPITRQQMAGFLVRYVDSQVEAGEMRSAYR